KKGDRESLRPILFILFISAVGGKADSCVQERMDSDFDFPRDGVPVGGDDGKNAHKNGENTQADKIPPEPPALSRCLISMDGVGLRFGQQSRRNPFLQFFMSRPHSAELYPIWQSVTIGFLLVTPPPDRGT